MSYMQKADDMFAMNDYSHSREECVYLQKAAELRYDFAYGDMENSVDGSIVIEDAFDLEEFPVEGYISAVVNGKRVFRDRNIGLLDHQS